MSAVTLVLTAGTFVVGAVLFWRGPPRRDAVGGAMTLAGAALIGIAAGFVVNWWLPLPP